MLTIRLSRTGKTSQPSFRIILQDKRTAVKGKALEILGHYQPAMKAKPIVLSKERLEHWVKHGARPSDSMAALLKKHGFSGMEKFMEPRNKKRAKKGEEAPAAKAAGAPAATATAIKEAKPA